LHLPGLFHAPVATLGAMPSAHRIAIRKLIDTCDKRIADDEARLLAVKNDDEREKLVDEIGDLMVKRKELMGALISDIG
jgi:predicted DNA-binding protein YlxM (UPF0122 family)